MTLEFNEQTKAEMEKAFPTMEKADKHVLSLTDIKDAMGALSDPKRMEQKQAETDLVKSVLGNVTITVENLAKTARECSGVWQKHDFNDAVNRYTAAAIDTAQDRLDAALLSPDSSKIIVKENGHDVRKTYATVGADWQVAYARGAYNADSGHYDGPAETDPKYDQGHPNTELARQYKEIRDGIEKKFPFLKTELKLVDPYTQSQAYALIVYMREGQGLN